MTGIIVSGFIALLGVSVMVLRWLYAVIIREQKYETPTMFNVGIVIYVCGMIAIATCFLIQLYQNQTP